MLHARVGRISPTRGLLALTLGSLIFASLSGQALAKGRHHRRAKAAKKEPASETTEAAAPALTPSCAAAWRAAVEHQKNGQLNEARDLFAACRQAACLPAVRKECSKQYDQMETDIPSVVAVVTDDAGEPRTDVEVKCDGKVVAASLDGRSVPVDPGVHEFSFCKDGEVFATQKIMVAEGQHHRLISASVPPPPGSEPKKATPPVAKRAAKGATPAKVNLAAAEPAAADQAKEEGDESSDKSSSSGGGDSGNADATLVAKTEAKSHTSGFTYVLAATGLVGVGGYGLLTYWGRKDNQMLSSCAPACINQNTDHIHKLYLGADVSLGVGIAALAGSYLVYTLTHNSGNKEEAAGTETAYRFDLQPTQSGAVASVAGRF